MENQHEALSRTLNDSESTPSFAQFTIQMEILGNGKVLNEFLEQLASNACSQDNTFVAQGFRLLQENRLMIHGKYSDFKPFPWQE